MQDTQVANHVFLELTLSIVMPKQVQTFGMEGFSNEPTLPLPPEFTPMAYFDSRLNGSIV